MMKILLALNSFKGSCSSLEANQALKSGLSSINPRDVFTVCPLCDGGDGSLEALKYHLKLDPVRVKTTDVLGKSITTYYLWDQLQSTAYIELAAASGLARLGARKNDILRVNTLGTGKLVEHALKKKPSCIVLLIGGSATNDAGLGILAALGYGFFGHRGKKLEPIPAHLIRIRSVSSSNYIRLKGTRFEIWTDVTNPFTGPSGAVSVYSKQKGANPFQQQKLEAGMLNFENVIKTQFGIDVQRIPGSGAAGGVGGGLAGLLGAEIHHGTKRIFELIRFDEVVASHDLIMTGEGALDDQTGYGKLVKGILYTAKKFGKPVIGVCGTLNLSGIQIRKMGLKAAFSIVPGPVDLEMAKLKALPFIRELGKNLGALLNIGLAYSSSSRRD